MTDEHTPTDQETQLYDALTAGDHEQIADMREDAYSTEPEADTQPDELTPAAQFDEDYAHAHAHYQADHEAPELERVEHTADTVSDENLTA